MTSTDGFPLDGGCDYRDVRYRMTTPPLFVHCCHCRWCQRETGASFALNAMIEADRIRKSYWPKESLERREALMAGKGR